MKGIRYKVSAIAYSLTGERLLKVHRLAGSLDSAELARQRNIESIRREIQRGDIKIVHRKEVI